MLQCKTLKHKHYSGWFLHWASATLRAEPTLSLSLSPPLRDTNTTSQPSLLCCSRISLSDKCTTDHPEAQHRGSERGCSVTGRGCYFQNSITSVVAAILVSFIIWFSGEKLQIISNSSIANYEGKKKKKSMFWFLETRMPCAGPSFHLYLPLHRWTKSTFWRHTMFCETH